MKTTPLKTFALCMPAAFTLLAGVATAQEISPLFAFWQHPTHCNQMVLGDKDVKNRASNFKQIYEADLKSVIDSFREQGSDEKVTRDTLQLLCEKKPGIPSGQ
jgi:hypothetical protein